MSCDFKNAGIGRFKYFLIFVSFVVMALGDYKAKIMLCIMPFYFILVSF